MNPTLGEKERRRLEKAAARMNGHAPNGADPEADDLAHVWADDIAFDLGKPGLVDGLLGTTGMTVLYGESGSGKTFVALDLACHVAAGMPWRGRDVEQGVVVYIAAESPESVERRVWAWKQHHGVEHLPLVVITATVDLLNGSTNKIIRFLARIREQHGRIALVVIDTLARAMTGNENAPDDMGKFVASCGRIREVCEGHVLIVHHCGKDLAKGARGHSSLRAATDVELEVANGVVKVTKHRDEAGGQTYGFRLETVELGENAKGRMVTTCVAVACDPPEHATGADKRKLGPNEQIALEALAAALCDRGREPPTTHDIPQKTSVVTLAEWQDAIVRYLPDDREPKRRKEAASRAIRSLTAAHKVRFVDPYVWIPPGRTGRTGSHVASCDHATVPAAGSHGSRVSLDTRPCDRATGTRDAAGETAPPEARYGPKDISRELPRPEVEPSVARPHATDARPSEHPDGGCSDDLEPESPPFAPAAEWQEVPAGTVLPPGCQIEVDVTTGQQRARLHPGVDEPSETVL